MKRILLFSLLTLIFVCPIAGQIEFQEITANNLPAVSQGATALTDVDGDNDLDLFITGNFQGTYIAKLFLNDGTGIFSEVVGTPFVGVSVSSVAFADIDGDNDQDILYFGFDNSLNRITKLYRNNGFGVFTEVTGTPFNGVAFSAIEFVDIDNDLDDDVIISGRIDNTFARLTNLYINDGSGNFSIDTGLILEGVEDGSINAADINNDNEIDLILTGLNNNNEAVTKLYINTAGALTETFSPFEGIYDSGMQLFADIDNDNDSDVLIFGRNFNAQAFGKIYRNVSIPASERAALIDLYNATDGPNWNFNTNWNTTNPVSTWQGVTVENDNVVSLNLSNQNLTGSLPNSLVDLTSLTNANFSNGTLSGVVPNLSSISTLNSYNVDRNNFSVDDLETNFTANSTITTFNYMRQSTVDSAISFQPAIGSDYTLSVTPDPGTNVSYQWYRERTGADVLITGATNATHDIINIQTNDLDNYICKITSSTLPDLEILRLPIELIGPVSTQERDALIAFYNALDGDNWTDNTNWLSSEPVANWSFITVSQGKVTEINIFGNANLNGVLPTEIGDLINLEMLWIGIETGLTGEIPSSIGNLTQLKRFGLQATSNSGSIPASIGNLVNLQVLRILATNLTGDLPSSLGNLTNLTEFIIDGGSEFNGLSNNFTGQIPASTGNLTSLETLNLARNSFEGEIPASFSNLTELISLNLTGNDLYGPLPDLTSSPNLDFIFLQDNYFDFSDLEPLVNNGVTYSSLLYSPQRTRDEVLSISSNIGDDILLNVNDTNINRSAENTAMNNNYQWFKDNTPITGANVNSYTIVNAQADDSGVYYCEITNTLLPNLIIQRAAITVNVGVLGIEENDISKIKIYPNPTDNQINISLPNTNNKAQISIYDPLGKQLLSQQLTQLQNSIELTHLQSGIYYLRIEFDNKTTTKTIIKN